MSLRSPDVYVQGQDCGLFGFTELFCQPVKREILNPGTEIDALR
jgi:hypothetical protein